MPLGEFVAEAVAQAVMELGGEAIRKRFGWSGCLVAIGSVIAVIALVIWLVR